VALAAGIGFGVGRSTGGRERDTAGTSIGPVLVQTLEGTALVQRNGQSSWENLKPGARIGLGTRLLVGPQSGLALSLEDKSGIQIGPNTACALLPGGGNGTEFEVTYGKVDLSLISPHPPFTVTTPQGRIEALGTVFSVVVE
jgi:hypothetical protein